MAPAMSSGLPSRVLWARRGVNQEDPGFFFDSPAKQTKKLGWRLLLILPIGMGADVLI